MFQYLGGSRVNRWWVKARLSLKVRVWGGCARVGGNGWRGRVGWAAVGHEVSPGCTPQHDVAHASLIMMQTKITTLLRMRCFNVCTYFDWDIAGEISKKIFRAITFDWSDLRT